MLRESALDDRDRAFTTDLVYGTLRERRALDYFLAQLSDRALEALDTPVRAALRLGAYQLMHGVPAHAAVRETVEVAPERARGYVNAVLRTLARLGPPWPWPDGDEVEALAVRSRTPTGSSNGSLPTSASKTRAPRWRSGTRPAPVALRVNPEMATPEAVRESSAPVASTWPGCARRRRASRPRHRGPAPARPRRRGSGDATRRSAARPSSRSSTPSRGDRLRRRRRTGWEGDRHRRAGRRGGAGASPSTSTRGGSGSSRRRRAVSGSQRSFRLLPTAAPCRPRRPAPIVCSSTLLVPAWACSAVGRRRAGASGPTGRAELAELQRELLRAAAEAVRPGGVVVYSVCTLTHEETSGVDWAAASSGLEAERPPGPPWRPRGGARCCCPRRGHGRDVRSPPQAHVGSRCRAMKLAPSILSADFAQTRRRGRPGRSRGRPAPRRRDGRRTSCRTSRSARRS